MAKTIQQTVTFRASPGALFDIYLNSKKHAAAIQAPASVSRRIGGRLTAFGGGLRGQNLAIVPKRLIVQAWRASNWRKTDLDSILILTFDKARSGGKVTLVHANVPDRWHAGIKKGWNAYYWRRWKAYLRRRSKTRARRA